MWERKLENTGKLEKYTYLLEFIKEIKFIDWFNHNHLENEVGLENEMMDMVKRDLSWACIERALNIQGFFTTLLNVYKNGYFPCSWIGNYPKGQVVVL